MFLQKRLQHTFAAAHIQNNLGMRQGQSLNQLVNLPEFFRRIVAGLPSGGVRVEKFLSFSVLCKVFALAASSKRAARPERRRNTG